MVAVFLIAFVVIGGRVAAPVGSSAARAALGLMGAAKMREIIDMDGPIIARFQSSGI